LSVKSAEKSFRSKECSKIISEMPMLKKKKKEKIKNLIVISVAKLLLNQKRTLNYMYKLSTY